MYRVPTMVQSCKSMCEIAKSEEWYYFRFSPQHGRLKGVNHFLRRIKLRKLRILKTTTLKCKKNTFNNIEQNEKLTLFQFSFSDSEPSTNRKLGIKTSSLSIFCGVEPLQATVWNPELQSHYSFLKPTRCCVFVSVHLCFISLLYSTISFIANNQVFILWFSCCCCFTLCGPVWEVCFWWWWSWHVVLRLLLSFDRRLNACRPRCF